MACPASCRQHNVGPASSRAITYQTLYLPFLCAPAACSSWMMCYKLTLLFGCRSRRSCGASSGSHPQTPAARCWSSAPGRMCWMSLRMRFRRTGFPLLMLEGGRPWRVQSAGSKLQNLLLPPTNLRPRRPHPICKFFCCWSSKVAMGSTSQVCPSYTRSPQKQSVSCTLICNAGWLHASDSHCQ